MLQLRLQLRWSHLNFTSVFPQIKLTKLENTCKSGKTPKPKNRIFKVRKLKNRTKNWPDTQNADELVDGYQTFCNCSHAQILVKIYSLAGRFTNPQISEESLGSARCFQAKYLIISERFVRAPTCLLPRREFRELDSRTSPSTFATRFIMAALALISNDKTLLTLWMLW